MGEWVNLIKEWGLNEVAIIALLFLIVKWTLATTKEILHQAADERMKSIKAWEEHTQQAKAFHDQVAEAHKHQREEHKEMIQILGRINGYK